MSAGARWSALIGFGGLAVSAYLTATHYLASQVPLACARGGMVDCEQVTTSGPSMVGPVPVASLGLVWFGLWLGLLAARRRWADGRLAWAQLAWAAAGLVVAFYLIFAELFLIGALCLWCTAVHAAVIALFLLSVAGLASGSPGGESAAVPADTRRRQAEATEEPVQARP